MSDIKQALKAVVKRILDGDGEATTIQRRAAFDNAVTDKPLSALVEKVALHPSTISDDDVSAVKKSGLSEDQIFEIVVCAAVGQAKRQYDDALAALATATRNE